MKTLTVHGCQNCPFCQYDILENLYCCERPDIYISSIHNIPEGEVSISKPPIICPFKKEETIKIELE